MTGYNALSDGREFYGSGYNYCNLFAIWCETQLLWCTEVSDDTSIVNQLYRHYHEQLNILAGQKGAFENV